MDRRTLSLVTGGHGFLGGRLVEMLRERGHVVRVASSNPPSPRSNVVHADLGDHAALARAVEGCETIFHLAYASGGSAKQQYRINVDGTMALAQAAQAAGVRRFVHVSSVAVYGRQPATNLDETTVRHPDDDYARIKHEIEQRLLAMYRADRFAVTILQPTIVYGPNGKTWTIEPLRQVKAGKVALPQMGQGICNAVYVDDVVQAAMLAADRPQAIGQTFLVSGPAPITWSAFYQSYEEMAGVSSVILMDDADLDATLASRYGTMLPLQRYRRGLEKILARLKIEPRGGAMWLPNPALRELYGAPTRVSIASARNMLGFVPTIDIDRGMALTAAWARDQKLVSSTVR